jgi:hypothetical protein
MTAIWFRPKRYGWGATPVTWQGWAVTLGFVAAIAVAAWALVGSRAHPKAADLGIFFVVEAILVALLVVISWRTTDGAWRWRWGDE